jgi:hypothetical protein
MTVVFLFFLAMLGILAHTGWTAFREAQHPHKSLWYDPAKHNTSLPVVNYLGREGLFDIGVTVWLAPTEIDVVGKRHLREANSSVKSALVDSSADPRDKLQPKDYDFLDSPPIPLYSDIVFRNATMRAKHLQETVKFALPIAHFCGLNVSTTDLKATFVLMPHEGSLLDKATNWSTVVPDWMIKAPVRPWP